MYIYDITVFQCANIFLYLHVYVFLPLQRFVLHFYTLASPVYIHIQFLYCSVCYSYTKKLIFNL